MNLSSVVSGLSIDVQCVGNEQFFPSIRDKVVRVLIGEEIVIFFVEHILSER